MLRLPLRRDGFAFLFAPGYHPAMKHAGPVRRELGVPTAFNLLGPHDQPGGRSPAGDRGGRSDGRAEGRPRAAPTGRRAGVRGPRRWAWTSCRWMGVASPTTCRRAACADGGSTSRRWVWESRRARELRGGDAAENAAIIEGVLDGETRAAARCGAAQRRRGAAGERPRRPTLRHGVEHRRSRRSIAVRLVRCWAACAKRAVASAA